MTVLDLKSTIFCHQNKLFHVLVVKLLCIHSCFFNLGKVIMAELMARNEQLYQSQPCCYFAENLAEKHRRLSKFSI